MNTREQLIDSLTAHIALYHSSSRNPSHNPNPHPRSAILRWFSSLSIPHRQSALTVVDTDFVAVLLQMLSRLRSSGEHGHGHFFLLPDLPSSSLPSLLFRRSRGLLRRAATADPHAAALSNSILLFSSNDGVAVHSPAFISTASHDSITVSDDLTSDLDRFVEIMDAVSGGSFLRGEETGLGRPWAELPWLKDKGYYSMDEFVANKLEIALRLSWLSSGGVKKKKGGKGKEKEKAAGVAGAAANAFWRKKGCIDWWLGLSTGCRKQFITVFLGKTASRMVLFFHGF